MIITRQGGVALRMYGVLRTPYICTTRRQPACLLWRRYQTARSQIRTRGGGGGGIGYREPLVAYSAAALATLSRRARRRVVHGPATATPYAVIVAAVSSISAAGPQRLRQGSWCFAANARAVLCDPQKRRAPCAG